MSNVLYIYGIMAVITFFMEYDSDRVGAAIVLAILSPLYWLKKIFNIIEFLWRIS